MPCNLLALLVAAATPIFAINGTIPNLSTTKSAIIAYYDSGRHDADVAKVTAQLQSYVDARLKAHARKPAVVFDIDDTSVSTYPYEKMYDFSFNASTWTQWEHQNKFPAIAPALQLARNLVKEHVAIFFITGRRQPDTAATKKELQQLGYPTPTGLYLRPVNDHTKSVIPYKSHMRAVIASNGYDILASIGDQWSDLKGGYAERLYKLPNAMYFLP